MWSGSSDRVAAECLDQTMVFAELSAKDQVDLANRLVLRQSDSNVFKEAFADATADEEEALTKRDRRGKENDSCYGFAQNGYRGIEAES
jgi:hypothetical protein